MTKQIDIMAKPLNEYNNKVKIMKGIIVSYLITIPLFAIFAFVLSNTDFPEKYLSTAVLVTIIISILIGGWISANGCRSKGWLNGGMVGLLYMLILYIVSSIMFFNFKVDFYVIKVTLLGILVGCIGGILGINLKSSSNYKRRN